METFWGASCPFPEETGPSRHPLPPRGGGDRFTGRLEGDGGRAPTAPPPPPETRPSSSAFCAVSARCRLRPKKPPLRHPRRPQLFIYLFSNKGAPLSFQFKTRKTSGGLVPKWARPFPPTLHPGSRLSSEITHEQPPTSPPSPASTARLDVGLELSCTLAPSKRGLG